MGRLAWAATYDREPVNETFAVMLNEPIVSLTFSRAFLERWMEEAPCKIVDFSTLTHTLDDFPKDPIPVNAVPSFGHKSA